MKKIFCILSLCLLFAASCEKGPDSETPVKSESSSLVVVAETIADHNVVIVKPSEAKSGAPVVVVLTDDLLLTTRNSPVAEVPEVNFKAAEHCLIGGYTLCVVKVAAGEDLSFLTSLKEGFTNASKFYLLSYCNGHAYTAAMQMPSEFAAFGCISGAIEVEAYKANSFTQPVSFVHVHATENSVYRWTGVEGKSASVPLSVGAIVAIDECTHYTTGELIPRQGKGLVSYTKYLGGKNGHEVVLYSVDGKSNGWCDAEFEVYNQIWNFFKNH